MIKLDAVYVIHQDCRLDRLAAHAKRQGYAVACILSSHSLFENERLIFKGNPSQEFHFLEFADLLTDKEMEACDIEANRKSLATGKGPDAYYEVFRIESLRLKGEKAVANFSRRYGCKTFFVAHGIGIDSRPWIERGARAMPAGIIKRPNLLQRLAARIPRVKTRFRKTFEVSFVRHGGGRIAFLGSLKRLRIRRGIQVETRKFHGTWSTFRTRDFLSGIHDEIVKSEPTRFWVPIHGFSSDLRKAFKPLTIVVDGFHPPNYPRSYIDMFGDSTFVTRNMFDREWFAQFGRGVHPSPEFLEPEVFSSASLEKRTPLQVVLLLNHAGDWSALINRSDTDRLIAAFAELAMELPEVTFIVRPHPGMARFEHEGSDSRLRVDNFVQWKNLANLSMSQATLEQDLARGDLFISEYSQTIIDAFRSGKMGLIANLTGRRSFMESFENLGFAMVNDYAGMKRVVEEVRSDPAQYAGRQNEAVSRYNKLLEESLNSAPLQSA